MQNTNADTPDISQIDLATMCVSMDRKFRPLAKYFERGVTFSEWDHVFRESTSTFDACDRILSWQFREALKLKFPRKKIWIVFVTPVPHDSMYPKTVCKLMKHSGRARVEFNTYEAALSAMNYFHTHKYTATHPDECSPWILPEQK